MSRLLAPALAGYGSRTYDDHNQRLFTARSKLILCSLQYMTLIKVFKGLAYPNEVYYS